jgi:hypothetical protein
MYQRELRKRIRERLRTGQLPPAFGSRTFGGRGRDVACDCCGEMITPHEIEYQVEFTPDSALCRKAFSTHIKCHWIWWEESDSQDRPWTSTHALSRVWNALREKH